MESQRLTNSDFSSGDAPRPPPEKPKKAIWLAVCLLVAGTFLLLTGLILYFTDPEAHGIALIILGSVVFVPGAYYSWIAYGAYKGYKGYSFSDIPNY